MPNFHSLHCHSVTSASNRLARLKARNACPRTIKRQEDRLEARKAVAEARRERLAAAVKNVTEILQNEVQCLLDKHFPQQGLNLSQEKP